MHNPLKQFMIRTALAAGLAAFATSAHAQSASATISGVAAGGGIFDYTILFKNTSPSASLEGFWYAWTQSGNNLSTAIVSGSAASSLGWSNTSLEGGTSISWQGGSGDALAAGQTASFTFQSTETPTAITSGSSGASVAYEGNIDFSQGASGDSTGVFSPVLVVPEPSSIALLAIGAVAMAFSVRHRRMVFGVVKK